MRKIRPVATLLLAALWTGLLLPVQMLAVSCGFKRLAEGVPQLYHGGLCRLLRIRVEVRGRALREGPVLFVSNHVSWLDILVLAKLLRAAFIAKHEVAGWPLFGLLAKLHGAVFIERRQARTAEHRDEMSRRLDAGDSLILFPEGTSSDGIRLLPFKSAFFSLAEREVKGRHLRVQPVSLTFARLDNLPVGRRSMAVYAWVGEQELVPHLWQFLAAGPSTVVVEFHAPVTIEEFASRKDLCRHCSDTIRRGVSAVLSGRPLAASPPVAASPPLSSSAPVPTSPALP